MAFSLSRNGEVSSWARRNNDTQLKALSTRHRSLAQSIQRTIACGSEWHTSSREEIDEMRQRLHGQCKRMLGIEYEVWTRSGHRGTPPTFVLPRTADFATTQTVADVVDEAFLPQDTLDAARAELRAERRSPAAPDIDAHLSPASEDPALEVQVDALMAAIREQMLVRVLACHMEGRRPARDAVDRSDELWERSEPGRPLRGSMREWKDAKEPYDPDGLVQGILSRYLEGRP